VNCWINELFLYYLPGMWVDNERSGQGTYIYANGDSYEGEWRKNQKHGDGVYTCASTKVKVQ